MRISRLQLFVLLAASLTDPAFAQRRLGDNGRVSDVMETGLFETSRTNPEIKMIDFGEKLRQRFQSGKLASYGSLRKSLR